MAINQAQNILSLIEAEHRQVEKLFAEIEKADSNELYECFNEIYKALTLHAKSEELVFYPAMREYEETEQYIEEAEAEHEEAKILLEEIKSLKPTDSEFKTKINSLKKAVQHHVKEEEIEIFSAISECMSEQQLSELGKEFQKTKAKLEEEVKTAMTT
ncbi:MAG: hemerythrin domain-containing protein [Aulosira sp. ZfuVER01]|nr:hemerythrin domain-containing protein [Aulosira sp. ZfuVER01]MDZ8002493.1 hemerythrin domain-containing protein [Aulosira sp. DedVER01a]MDZ8050829.1 hemerythrin domain-containing protein [Aulosira sp. ZfuCHP01]